MVQCFDLANQYWYYVTGHALRGLYAKDIPFANNFDGYANVVKTIAHMYLKGISYFPYEYGNGSGHVAIIESATQNYFYSLDQNWYGALKIIHQR